MCFDCKACCKCEGKYYVVVQKLVAGQRDDKQMAFRVTSEHAWIEPGGRVALCCSPSKDDELVALV